ncbi:MAG TPA: response regulator [Vicinamibacteria bacterium]|nr:response regulator [Vicinamibacteria bacterium]
MSTKNLLVVDDSATTRMLISLTLKKEGVYRIVEVSNGREAVDKLSVEPVDCVLTDINMPQMNGLDLISYIRSQHREPKLPIIVITTQGEEEDRDKSMAQGANAYLTKPISGPKLVSLVKELLD